MPYAQTSTALGALTAVTAGSWVNVPRGSAQQPTGGGAGPIVMIVASDTDAGGSVAIEGRMAKAGDFTTAKRYHTITTDADTTHIIPLRDMIENGVMPDQVRINATVVTDGTYTGSILTAS